MQFVLERFFFAAYNKRREENCFLCVYPHLEVIEEHPFCIRWPFSFYDTLTGKEHLPLTYPNIVYDILVNAMITKKFK